VEVTAALVIPTTNVPTTFASTKLVQAFLLWVPLARQLLNVLRGLRATPRTQANPRSVATEERVVPARTNAHGMTVLADSVKGRLIWVLHVARTLTVEEELNALLRSKTDPHYAAIQMQNVPATVSAPSISASPELVLGCTLLDRLAKRPRSVKTEPSASV
jgi:hypothetical protein